MGRSLELGSVKHGDKPSRAALANPNVTAGVRKLGRVRVHSQLQRRAAMDLTVLFRLDQPLLNQPFGELRGRVHQHILDLGVQLRSIRRNLIRRTQRGTSNYHQRRERLSLNLTERDLPRVRNRFTRIILGQIDDGRRLCRYLLLLLVPTNQQPSNRRRLRRSNITSSDALRFLRLFRRLHIRHHRLLIRQFLVVLLLQRFLRGSLLRRLLLHFQPLGQRNVLLIIIVRGKISPRIPSIIVRFVLRPATLALATLQRRRSTPLRGTRRRHHRWRLLLRQRRNRLRDLLQPRNRPQHLVRRKHLPRKDVLPARLLHNVLQLAPDVVVLLFGLLVGGLLRRAQLVRPVLEPQRNFILRQGRHVGFFPTPKMPPLSNVIFAA
uniref:(northern house mosquito) hypothetical protein n=1 Tax=Culex pipiens TaxID=7175 RepID=A0A8D8AGV0_CULPI